MIKQQKGFGALEGLLVILILLVVSFGGWYVWNNSSNKDESTADKSLVQTESANLQSNADTAATNAAPASSSKKYLEISELGVKLALTDQTDDLTFSMDSSKTAILSSSSLSKAEPKCAADYRGSENNDVYGIGMLSYFTDPNGYELFGGDTTNISAYPEATKVSDKYFYFATNQSYCVNVGSNNNPGDTAYDIETELVKAIKNKDIKIEKL